ELFGGYEEYDETPTMRKFKKVPGFIRRPIAEVAKVMPEMRGKHFLMKGGLPVEQTFIGQARIFEEDEAASLLQPAFQNAPSVKDIVTPVYKKAAGQDDVTKKQVLDFHLWLVDDILLKADKMSMAHSIELRVPFLDKEVMRVATKVPTRYRVNEVDTKFAFRKASEKALPEEWAKRKKIGFPVPIRLWLKEEKYYNQIKQTFESDVAGQFFDQEAIVKLLTDHYEGHAKNQRKVWTIYMFLLWYNKYFG
ncbi:MAG: asparagine synthase C-terminal domain-containing protein, partial [Lysinibacillus sp.]